MFEKPDVMSLAASLAAHAAARQSAIARNVANADTPGYRALDLPDFDKTYRSESGADMRHTRAGHVGGEADSMQIVPPEISARGSLSPNGNSVSLETEMVKAADVRREHDMALAIYGKSISILRASLGRR
ncbi:MAG: FlgB family protein [Rhodobacteraceae bacterium]|nr:FlgB family protein [Paracoccaceae bacterium]